MVEAFNVMQDRITARGSPAIRPTSYQPAARRGRLVRFPPRRRSHRHRRRATEKAIEAVTEAVTALSQHYGSNGSGK